MKTLLTIVLAFLTGCASTNELSIKRLDYAIWTMDNTAAYFESCRRDMEQAACSPEDYAYMLEQRRVAMEIIRAHKPLSRAVPSGSSGSDYDNRLQRLESEQTRRQHSDMARRACENAHGSGAFICRNF